MIRDWFFMWRREFANYNAGTFQKDLLAGLTVAAVRRLVSAGVIPAESDRGRFCLDVAEVERYAEHRRACGIR